MRDWNAYVRDRLPMKALQRRRADRIVEELAGQLEEIHAGACAHGASAAEADAEVERHIADWERMASDVTVAERPNREPVVSRWLDRAEEKTRRFGVTGRFTADFARDVRYALRGLRRSPGFAAAIVVVLALGIGATTAMFAVVDTLLLEPLPYPEPERLMTVWSTTPGEGRSTLPLSGPNYVDLRERSSSFEDLGVQTLSWVNLSGEGRPERVRACECTAGLLRSLAVAPALGRLFTDREVEDGERLAVLSESLWQRQSGGTGDILGSTIAINGDPYTVVGVMPSGFTTPRPWSTPSGAELWLPVAVTGGHSPRSQNWLFAIGRLAPGVTPEVAGAEVGSIAAGLATEYPDTNARTDFWVLPLAERMVRGVSSSLLFLVVGAALLLLTAAANAASIAFARATARQPLSAIRASLGASRVRLVRQLVTESLVLSSAGGLVGLLVAWWGVGVLRRAIPATVQRAEGIALDPSVLLLALAATVAIGGLVGLAVGLNNSRGDVVSLVRENLRSHTRGRRRARLHGAMVAAQFALTLLLANGTALMLRSYLNAVRVPLAFDSEGTVTAGLTLEGEAYEDDVVARLFWEGLLEGVRRLPGAEAVGLTSKLPLNGGTNGSVLVEKEEFNAALDRPLVEFSYASAEYFDAMGIAVLEGRTFVPGDEDDGTLGLIVNRAFAERYFPEENALGRVVSENSSERSWSGRIVGVVEDVPQWGLESATLREVYFPFARRTISSPWLVVGAAGAPAGLVPGIRQVLAALDSSVPLSSVRTMSEVVAADVRPRRLMTIAIGLFAVVGLVLGGIGIYGVVAYHMARRRHEIGVRMAIGAERRTVVWMVLSQGLMLAGIGTLLGLAVSVAISKVLSGLLFRVAPVDPVSLVVVVLLLAAIALAGTAVPALRAAAVDPVETLRSE